MMNLLDAVLEQTSRNRGARVVSENHDEGTINWVAGLSDPGEMIGCGMYQNLRRLAGESDQDYARRLNEELATVPSLVRAKIETAMKAAALQRASLDTSNGRVNVVVAGEPAWHGLGVNVAEAMTAAQAIGLAGLNWTVSKRAMSFRRQDGSYMESADTFALVRDDTEEQLAVVGSRYQVIQNQDGFGFLDKVVGEFGARFHTAGAIFRGGKVWMQCELPEHGFEVVNGDHVQAFATFTNPHDASGKAWCYPTTNRIVCANSFRTASRERAKGLGIRHTGNVKASIADARAVLGIAIREIDEFKENAEVMARTPVKAEPYFQDLLDAVCEVTQADAMKGADALAAVLKVDEAQRELERKRLAREIERRENMLEEILTRYEAGTNAVSGIRGTQWAAFNAVTEYADHTRPRRQMGSEEERKSRQFESILTGSADDLKQIAYQKLTAM